MKKHVCSRCHTEQTMSAHQVLRFDTQIQHLCNDCWEAFRSWFFAGGRITRIADPMKPSGPHDTEKVA